MLWNNRGLFDKPLSSVSNSQLHTHMILAFFKPLASRDIICSVTQCVMPHVFS